MTSHPGPSSSQNQPYQGYPYTNPIVIDVPSLHPTTANKWNNLPRRPITTKNTDTSVSYIKTDKTTDNDDPVVYIEQNNATTTPVTPDFVKETIFFDPFEDRRIDSPQFESPKPSPKPARQAPAVPSSFQNKQTLVYGRNVQEDDDDGFPLSPIPVNEFPDPPPAYSEIDRPRRTLTETPRRSEAAAPRTRIILPQTEVPTSQANGTNRKYVSCQHCGMRVHTIVLKQVGLVTHVIALSALFFCLFPFTLLAYCTNFCKYENHYCPYCNKLIGYEVPILCQKLVFVEADSQNRTAT